MRATRTGAGVMALVLVISAVACTNSSDTVDEGTTPSTTASSPSETSDLEAANARIAELEAELFTATSTTVPLTTTTTLPREFTVASHEAGEYVIDPTITSVWGRVSDPNAEREVNNMPLAVGDYADPWWYFGPPEDETWSIPLSEGRNMLMFTATFPDGATLVDDPVVYHDPTLTKQLGILTDYRFDEPRTMTFDTGTEYHQDAGGPITNRGIAMPDLTIDHQPSSLSGGSQTAIASSLGVVSTTPRATAIVLTSPVNMRASPACRLWDSDISADQRGSSKNARPSTSPAST